MEALGGIVPTQRRDCRKTPLCPERAGRGSSAAADLAEAQAEEKLRLREARGAPWPRLAPGLPVPLRASAAQDQPRPLPLSADSEGGGEEKGGSCWGGGAARREQQPPAAGGGPGRGLGEPPLPFAPEPLSAAPRRGRGPGGSGGLRRALPKRGRRRWAPPDPKGRQRGWRPGAPGPQRKKAAGCGAMRCGGIRLIGLSV